MKFALMVNAAPYTHQASDSAWHFATAALVGGHEILRVFFYHDGVHNGSRLARPPQDDRHIVRRWSELGRAHKLDLVLCVAAAQRRGLGDENIAPGFRIGGLGQLIEVCIHADRIIEFGD